MPPRVALIGTGGTISSLGRDSLDVWEYMDGGQMIGPADLLARYPETARVATVVPAPYKAVASSSIGPADWLRLIETIDARAGDLRVRRRLAHGPPTDSARRHHPADRRHGPGG